MVGRQRADTSVASSLSVCLDTPEGLCAADDAAAVS